MALMRFSPRPRWRGFSFVLHLLRVQGFYFAQTQYSPIQAVYGAFYAVNAVYTANATKQHTGLCSGFSYYLPCFAAAVWRVHPAIPHRLRHAGRCAAQHSRPIIIMYIRVRGAPCYGSMPDGATHRRPCKPGGVSSCRVRIAGKCYTRRTC